LKEHVLLVGGNTSYDLINLYRKIPVAGKRDFEKTGGKRRKW
jgi:hypothetical protein